MNKSLWISSSEGERYKTLDDDKRVKCLIVGGGITGITTAYLLCKKGIPVVLVDADFIAYGASGRNTGKVCAQHSIIYSNIYNMYGAANARQYYDANKDAIRLIEEIIEENDIDCDYERAPSYIFTQSDNESDKLLEEFNICKELGIDCEFTMKIELPLEIKGAVKFNIGGQFNPKKYVDALAKKVIEMGGEIYEKTPMKSVDIEEDLITVNSLYGYKIKTEKLIIASHFPFYDGLSFYFTRLKPERSYVVAGEYDKDFPKATFINMEEPTRSLRVYEDGKKRFLLIGGESHKVAHNNEKDCYGRLKEFGKEVFGLEKYEFEWSTQDYITPDGIPYIGYLNTIRENILVATGFAKWGMTNGTVAAMMLSDIYSNGRSKYSNAFTPSRTEGYFTSEFFKENLDVGIQYVKGKFKIASKDMPDRDEAKVALIDKKRFGVYRDNQDILHIVDITCTHLGCKLNWNQLEKTWDCPCHGSRFSIDGDILEGPANIPLKKYGDDTYNSIHPNLL